MKTADFDYDLPEEFIAQAPLRKRDESRLLVYFRSGDKIEHVIFSDIGKFLSPGDLLVLNETRVISARIFVKKQPGGGKAELLLLRKIDPLVWEVIVGGKGLSAGRTLEIAGGPTAEIVRVLNGPIRLVKFSSPIDDLLINIGNVPLPPYIHQDIEDPSRYQTVYARVSGSAAAPTAGFHFTLDLIQELQREGILFANVILHVGLDTFLPVSEENPRLHQIHSEWCQLSIEAADIINETRRRGGRIIAVGTTSVRVLESAAQKASEGEAVAPFEGFTDLFILPGHKFQAVDCMVTNFHLPKSTLIMLVSAFTGRKNILSLYKIAKNLGYRFYSFGDAMLIL